MSPALVPNPMDEYPVHQTPLSLSYVGSSDRNFYDRCYFNGHDRTGDVFFVTGMGYYPNLGVMDAFATVRHGDLQHAVRFSDAISNDRLHPSVGGYRIEIIEPLHSLRLICDGSEHEVSFDLRFQGSFPCVQEQPHVMRTGARPILDASRFAQVGSWSGTLHAGGTDFVVDPEVWMGTRDRSWGIRPVGEPEPQGRSADEGLEGFWWLYVPLRFDDFAVIVICQELPDGFRTLNDATRIWADGRVEQLGWPDIDITYAAGTRHPTQATLRLKDDLQIDVTTLGFVGLNVGAGYGGDPDWSHGRWMGRDWSDGGTYDMTDPMIAGRIPFSVVDHVAAATCHGPTGAQRGWGLFEHGTFGRHDPSGFADWDSLAL